MDPSTNKLMTETRDPAITVVFAPSPLPPESDRFGVWCEAGLSCTRLPRVSFPPPPGFCGSPMASSGLNTASLVPEEVVGLFSFESLFQKQLKDIP